MDGNSPRVRSATRTGTALVEETLSNSSCSRTLSSSQTERRFLARGNECLGLRDLILDRSALLLVKEILVPIGFTCGHFSDSGRRPRTIQTHPEGTSMEIHPLRALRQLDHALRRWVVEAPAGSPNVGWENFVGPTLKDNRQAGCSLSSCFPSGARCPLLGTIFHIAAGLVRWP